MPRWSSLTIGLGVLAVVVLGVGIIIVSRPRHPREEAILPAESEEVPPRSVSNPSPPLAGPEAEPRHGRAALPAHPLERPSPEDPQPPSQPLSVDASTTADGWESRQDARQAETRKRGLLIALNNQKRREEADERVFELRKVSDSARVAIRQINEVYTDRVRTSGSAPSDGPIVGTQSATALPHTTDAERARQDALNNLLGIDAAKEFGAAERIAIQQVRGKYRLEQARLLRKQ